MTYRSAKRKLFFELLIMYPFVLVGKILGHLFPLKTKHKIFLLFPNADAGGSATVNLDILNCYKDLNPIIIFTKKPKNNLFIEKYKHQPFKQIDFSKYIDYKIYHFVNFIFRGILATWINKQDAVLFSGECMYFYKILPHVKRNILSVELSHLNTWMNYNIGFIDRIDKRVFSTEELKKKVEGQYRHNNLPAHFYEKLFFIDNTVDIPKYELNENKKLQVYFIGRGVAQKRIYLIAAIAKNIYEKKLPVKFNFVGDVDKVINIDEYPYCHFHGSIKDDARMNQVYREADVLLLTSAYEGLPMVVIQMMAHAKPIISTAVNGIPDYIEHMKNGLLIYTKDEAEIINEGTKFVELLFQQSQLRIEMGMESRKIAVQRFSRGIFNKKYQELILK